MKAGKTLVDLATELQNQLKTKKDYIAMTSVLTMSPELKVTGVNGNQFGVTKYAHGQLAGKLGIPKQYYDRMLQEAPELLAHNVNAWFQKNPEKRMIRTINNNIRAYLSDRYRPIDNYDLAEHVLPKIQKMGCKIESCELTETRMYIKAVTPKVQFEVQKGDMVQAGLVISNSEVGAGSVKIEPLIYRLVCLNGMIAADSSLRKYHTGRYTEQLGEAVELFSKKTLVADNKAFFMKVVDIVDAVFQEDSFKGIVSRMQDATKRPIEKDPVKLIEDVTKRFQLREEEAGGVLKHLINGGALSQYGLMNAMTRTSQDIEDYDRATEFERMGGDVLELGKEEWEKIAG
jgi:hypothetical protein